MSNQIFFLEKIVHSAKMNMIKRLRNHEIYDKQQEFQYTKKILKALAQEPRIVIPVSTQAVTEVRVLKTTIKAFFRRYNLQSSSAYQKLRLFNIDATEVLFYKCYVLLYTSKHAKINVNFNLYHKIQFLHDLLLQAG